MFRLHDPAIGRFHQIDPLVDFLSGISPYNFAYNNPMTYIDPTGLAGNKCKNLKDYYGYFRAGLNKVGIKMKGIKNEAGYWGNYKTRNNKPKKKKSKGSSEGTTPVPSSNNRPIVVGSISGSPTPSPPSPFGRTTPDDLVENTWLMPPVPRPIPKPKRIFPTGYELNLESNVFNAYEFSFVNEPDTRAFLVPVAEEMKAFKESIITIVIHTTGSAPPIGERESRNFDNGNSIAWALGGRITAIRNILQEMGVERNRLETRWQYDSEIKVTIEFK